MVSDNDTDEQSGSTRESTDPSFPGPMHAKKSGTDPGFPPASSPSGKPPAHEIRVSDTLPAAAAVAPNEKPKTRSSAPPAAGARASSDPPPSRPKARTESIDELIDGLAGEGILPRKAKPASDSKIAAAARPPAPVAPPQEPLPSVLVRPDSQPDAGMDDSLDGDRRSDPTVLTPVAIARRSRGKTWLAGLMGIILAVAVLALIRKATRPDEDVPPATAHGAVATTTSAVASPPVAPTAPANAATSVAPSPESSAHAVVAPVESAKPRDVRPRVEASSAAPASAPARSGTAPPRSSSELQDFRKTIRQ